MPLTAVSRQTRRRFPRLELEGGIPLRDVTLGSMMEVLDVSVGGCRTLCPIPLKPGTHHRFQATLHTQVVPFVAKVVHCRGTADLRGPYVVGWQWNDDATTAQSIRRFVEHVTTAETFAPGEE